MIIYIFIVLFIHKNKIRGGDSAVLIIIQFCKIFIWKVGHGQWTRVSSQCNNAHINVKKCAIDISNRKIKIPHEPGVRMLTTMCSFGISFKRKQKNIHETTRT